MCVICIRDSLIANFPRRLPSMQRPSIISFIKLKKRRENRPRRLSEYTRQLPGIFIASNPYLSCQLFIPRGIIKAPVFQLALESLSPLSLFLSRCLSLSFFSSLTVSVSFLPSLFLSPSLSLSFVLSRFLARFLLSFLIHAFYFIYPQYKRMLRNQCIQNIT